jgi:outer membrane protein assembly factor BamB
MNLIKQCLILATATVVTATSLVSCKKYSSDTPLPDVYNQTLFVGSNNQIVYALDPNTGDVKWKYSVEGEVIATPLYHNGSVYIGTNIGKWYQLSAQYGTLTNSHSFSGPIIATPIVRDGRIILCEGSIVHSLDPNSFADLAINSISVTYDAGGVIMASPTLHSIKGGEFNTIFVATMSNKLAALNGQLSEIKSFTPAEGGAFYSSPCVISDEFAYIGNDNGYVYAVNTSDFSEKWKFKTDGQVRCSPIQIGGNVLVGSNDRYFYSVDSTLGQLRWKVKTGDVIQSSPVVYNQNVYFGSYDGKMYCVDIIDGTVKWDMLTGGLIKSSPVYYRGDIYFGGYDKNLYRLDAETGDQKMNPVNIYGQMATSPIIDSVGGAAVPSISGAYRY